MMRVEDLREVMDQIATDAEKAELEHSQEMYPATALHFLLGQITYLHETYPFVHRYFVEDMGPPVIGGSDDR